MFRPIGRARVMTLAVLLGLLMAVGASCGDDSGADAAGDGVDATESATDGYESPLLDALGINAGLLAGNDPAALQSQQLALNEDVKACMAAEGFEWEPSPASAAMFGGGDLFDGLDPDSTEWAERFGFGASTLAFAQEQVGPDLVGIAIDTPDPDDDPNADYLAGLSDADREAYNEALYGDSVVTPVMSDEEAQQVGEEMMLNPSGCLAEAQNDMFGADAMSTLIELGPDLQELYDEIYNDPRIVELEDEVRACVSDQGLEYIPTAEVYEYFGGKVAPLQAELGFGPSEELPTLDEEQRATLAEIQAEEVALAVAVDGCTQDDKFDDTAEAVRLEYEQRFVDENQARIDELTTGE